MNQEKRWSQESKVREVPRTGLASLEQELWSPSEYSEIKARPGLTDSDAALSELCNFLAG